MSCELKKGLFLDTEEHPKIERQTVQITVSLI